jgi:ADP-ribose pyrophosphatase YjhB (NUDIX family)
MKRDFTATTYIFEGDSILLIFHRKLQKWLPPGGHLNPNELPHEGAIREAKEETGIDVEIILDENTWVERWNASSFPRPYFCLLQEIPAFGDEPAHQHVDFSFIAKPIGGETCHQAEEVDAARWFTLAEIEELESDKDIFEETKRNMRTFFATFAEAPCSKS